jgi:hypothetical protein
LFDGRFALVGLLAALYSPEAIAIRRLAIAESRHSDIGKVVFEGSMVPIEKPVAEFLKKGMKRGTLRTGDPKDRRDAGTQPSRVRISATRPARRRQLGEAAGIEQRCTASGRDIPVRVYTPLGQRCLSRVTCARIIYSSRGGSSAAALEITRLNGLSILRNKENLVPGRGT